MPKYPYTIIELVPDQPPCMRTVRLQSEADVAEELSNLFVMRTHLRAALLEGQVMVLYHGEVINIKVFEATLTPPDIAFLPRGSSGD